MIKNVNQLKIVRAPFTWVLERVKYYILNIPILFIRTMVSVLR
jgi:hypothetical protein